MPTYEYQCESCRHEFTMIMSISEHDRATVTCPACGSEQIRQLVSTFTAQTSRKS